MAQPRPLSSTNLVKLTTLPSTHVLNSRPSVSIFLSTFSFIYLISSINIDILSIFSRHLIIPEPICKILQNFKIFFSKSFLALPLSSTIQTNNPQVAAAALTSLKKNTVLFLSFFFFFSLPSVHNSVSLLFLTVHCRERTDSSFYKGKILWR